MQTLPSARSALNRPLNRLLTQLRSNGFRSAPTDSLAIPIQCTRRDLNPHALRRRNLNPVGMYRDAARCSERRISPGSSLHLAAFRYSPWTIQRRFTGLRRRLGRANLRGSSGRLGVIQAPNLNRRPLQCRMHCMAQRADAQLTFRLPKKIAGDLSRIAARRGLQRSDLLREVVEQMVAEEAKASSHFERVKDLIGAASTGQADLGSEHRRHLKNGFGRDR